jgi:predicted RNA-binding Zn-ribbon protein involved in translation (DUF1610 family)
MSKSVAKRPRILFLDIETFPNIAYVWGKYEQNVIRYTRETCLATFSAKWQGESKMISRGLDDYPGYKAGSYDDTLLVKDLWKLFDEADMIVAHNGDQFDIKVSQARFIFHKLNPPTPFKTVDTKKVAKGAFKFNSNKMDDIGSLLGLGRKIKTDFDLWEGCINGDPVMWARMKRYNNYDVTLLERLYNRMLPWADKHPNFTTGEVACPKCGSFDINYRGTQRAVTRSYNRFQCQKCGGWGRTVKSVGKAIVQNVGSRN